MCTGCIPEFAQHLISLPSDWTQRGERKPEKSIQQFFCREEREKAVKEENIQLFKPDPVPTPVMIAATMQEKLNLRD